MSSAQAKRGSTSVGFITDLGGLEAASVIYPHLWRDGPDAQAQVWNDFAAALGVSHGRRALQSFDELCGLCARHGRRPLLRHSVTCKYLGSDESCFANFIGTAAEGELEGALLIVTLLVRPDVAPLIASLACAFGLALRRMQLSAPRNMARMRPETTTLH